MKNNIMIVIYVNDLIFTKFNFAIIFWLKNALNDRFEMSDLNSCIYYLDMMIFRNRRLKLLILNQSFYVEQMLRDHEMWNCKSLIIFMNVSCRFIKAFDEYIVASSDTEAELRDHVIWLQSRDVTKMTVYRSK
jgi:hypothetical protein